MAQIRVTQSTNGSLTIGSLMGALAKHGGFRRVDDLFRDIYGRLPVYNAHSKVSELHQFIDDLEEKCTTTKTLALEGTPGMERAAVIISWRNKSRVEGIDENVFPKEQLLPDVRPPKRARKSKGTTEPKETNDWIPGVALVEPEWFSRDATATVMLGEYQTALHDMGLENASFSRIGLGRATVSSCKPSSDGGFLVTLRVPEPIQAPVDEDDSDDADSIDVE